MDATATWPPATARATLPHTSVDATTAVASILSGSDQDPHSYEASPSDAAAIADAGQPADAQY
ncbi:hypothetical protein MAHJHV57_50170 [Mycobacterium avium subsp. hominissuis]